MPTVPSYSYTPGQRLASRTWARGITTSYGYDHAGGLLSVSYNDSVTPNITNGYDRRGRQTNITQTYPDTSTVVCTMTYNDQNQLLTRIL